MTLIPARACYDPRVNVSQGATLGYGIFGWGEMANGLTVKQERFVAAYIGGARGNATEAARLAGYKGTAKTLGVVGAENLAKPSIADAIEEYRRKVAQTGIAYLQTRVDGYNERRTALLSIVNARAEHTDFSDVPGGRTGYLAKTVKQIGGGDTAERVEEFAVDTGLLRELRELEKQAAQDLGQWSEKQVHSSPDGAPFAIVFRERSDGPQ